MSFDDAKIVERKSDLQINGAIGKAIGMNCILWGGNVAKLQDFSCKWGELQSKLHSYWGVLMHE